jgi:hypothetical protein
MLGTRKWKGKENGDRKTDSQERDEKFVSKRAALQRHAAASHACPPRRHHAATDRYWIRKSTIGCVWPLVRPPCSGKWCELSLLSWFCALAEGSPHLCSKAIGRSRLLMAAPGIAAHLRAADRPFCPCTCALVKLGCFSFLFPPLSPSFQIHFLSLSLFLPGRLCMITFLALLPFCGIWQLRPAP